VSKKRLNQSLRSIQFSHANKTYNSITIGWAQSKDDRKALMARNLLEWMLAEYQNGNAFIKPNSSSYNFVMKACIKSSKYLKPQQKRRNFEILLNTFEELSRSQNARPGLISYRMMLNACQLLLPECSERLAYAKELFHDCCRIGLVDEIIYSIFLDMCDDHTLRTTVGHDVKTWTELPLEWKRNIGTVHRNERS
jgi:hypothetical protein